MTDAYDVTHSAPYLGAFRLEPSAQVGEHASRFVGREREGGPSSERFEVRAIHGVTPSLRVRLRLLKELDHEGLLPIVTMRLEGAPPHYITTRPPTGGWLDTPPNNVAQLRAELHVLADALASAHRMGVVHGAIEPRHLLRGPTGFWLDLTGTDPHPSRASAPELVGAAVPTAAADVWALGRIVRAHALSSADPTLSALLDEMLAIDPEARPTASDVARRIDPSRPVPSPFGPGGLAPESSDIPARLGPYTLLEKLGEGGMGAVFRARASSDVDAPEVALKVMLPEWARDRRALARFRREARVLAQIENPYVARFVAAQSDGAFEYMVMEFVEGRSAQWLLKKRGPFTVPAALAIACDIARALVDVHALALVHRDIKPSNILIAADSEVAIAPRAKLCDFGIVREGMGDAEMLTQAERPGTPSFMSPEQILGQPVEAPTDLYALGATLYTLLVGTPPYVGNATLVMAAHVRDPIPDVRAKRPEVDERLAATLTRVLSKDPAARHASARELLDALESARGMSVESNAALPLPIALAGQSVPYAFSWDLDSRPDELWPHVSNTERLNRAIGLDEVAWTFEGQGDERTRSGSFRAAGMKLEWKENPFEWVAPHRLGVVREYRSGPFEWMRNVVDLAPTAEGTRLTHRIEIKPRHFLGRAAAMVEIGVRLRRALEQTYQRIDQTCVAARHADVVGVDPFEPAGKLARAAAERIDEALARVVQLGGSAEIAKALRAWVAVAPPQTLGRIRAFVWADERRFARSETFETFLLASSQRVLSVCWDILCPTCRVPSDLHESLATLKSHGRCDACDLDYEIDLARSVELVFRVDPTLRASDQGLYCVGGPAHSPHVVAQVRLEKGKRFHLEVSLEPGTYLLRGRELPSTYTLVVRDGVASNEWPISLRDDPDPISRRLVGPGRISIAMTNDTSRSAVVRLERSEGRSDVITAAHAASSATFRRLFPAEVLAPHELVGISRVALVLAEVPDATARYRTEDERAVHQDIVALQLEVSRAAELEGGASVKMQGEGVLAVFTEPLAATRAAMRVLGALGARAKVAVHTGPAMLMTINERLDYFGRHVHATSELLEATEAGELTLSEDVQRADVRALEAVRSGPFELAAIAQCTLLGLRYRLLA